ncbi:hypothetical protein ACIQNG_07550 [Streptomyces sp. NPDC091377]|uniref:hypothetical protein n=1 Tax=Streptomyces sp. NPDC091377 TaxID=3365995 RepID=UPI0037F1B304
MNAPVLAGRSVRGATALRGGGVRRPTPYQVFGFLFWLVVSLAYWRVPLCCDAGLDAAVVERLTADLVDPRHPVADLPGAGSPLYSPYAFAQAVAARLTGLGGWEVVRLSGPVNLLVLLTGLGRFVRMLGPRPWAPVLALAALTLLWGTRPLPGTGSLGLLPLTSGLGAPTVCALGLTLWAWALTGTRARDAGPDGRPGQVRFVGPSGLPSPVGHVLLGALYGVVLLVDPVVAVGAAAGAAALIASRRGRGRGRGRERGQGRRRGSGRGTVERRAGSVRGRVRAAVAGRWGLTALTAGAVAWSWPYYVPFGALGEGGVPAVPLGACWLALSAGLPALWLRVRRDGWRDPLVLMAGAVGAVLVAVMAVVAVMAYGWSVGGQVGRGPAVGGLVALALAPLQCAAAVELAAPRPWSAGRRLLGAVAAAGVGAGLLGAQAGAVVPRAWDPVGFPQPPGGPSYAWAAQHVGRGEVVLAEGRDTVHGLAGHGLDVVAPAVADPAVDEGERRRRLADVRAYLSPGSTGAERAAVVRRYEVRWVLLTRQREVPQGAVVVTWSERTGEVLARVGRPGPAHPRARPAATR